MCLCAPAGFHSDDIPEELAGLFGAISRGDYALIYEELDRFAGSFSAWDAFRLLNAALAKDLKPEIFEAVLERSPPAPDVISANPQKSSDGPLERAARAGRTDVLALFIERGASPNLRPGSFFSPLEMALSGESLKSVEFLLRQPELDTAWTDSLLQGWARPCGPGSVRESCLRAMAPRFTGWDPGSGQQLPIPEPMTPFIIVFDDNWPMLERFCRERAPVSPEDGRGVLGAFRTFKASSRVLEEKDQTACAGALAALLESCPGLLEGEEECRQLLLCFGCFGGTARARLRPWVEGLGPRRIAMDWVDGEEWNFIDLPAVCRALPPNGPVLAVDRWTPFLDPYNLELEDLFYDVPLLAKKLGEILDVCPIRGQGRKGELSPLAQAVLRFCGVPLIESLFQRPDGLLATEDPDALIEFVQTRCPRANRAAVAAYIRKRTDYSL